MTAVMGYDITSDKEYTSTYEDLLCVSSQFRYWVVVYIIDLRQGLSFATL